MFLIVTNAVVPKYYNRKPPIGQPLFSHFCNWVSGCKENSNRRDTPPGVSAPHRQKKDRVKISTSLRGAKRRTPGWLLLPYGQFTFWQSASPCAALPVPDGDGRRTDCHVGLCPPRNDSVGEASPSVSGCGGCVGASVELCAAENIEGKPGRYGFCWFFSCKFLCFGV